MKLRAELMNVLCVISSLTYSSIVCGSSLAISSSRSVPH